MEHGRERVVDRAREDAVVERVEQCAQFSSGLWPHPGHDQVQQRPDVVVAVAQAGVVAVPGGQVTSGSPAGAFPTAERVGDGPGVQAGGTFELRDLTVRGRADTSDDRSPGDGIPPRNAGEAGRWRTNAARRGFRRAGPGTGRPGRRGAAW